MPTFFLLRLQLQKSLTPRHPLGALVKGCWDFAVCALLLLLLLLLLQCAHHH
jgi:hypothetical protein